MSILHKYIQKIPHLVHGIRLNNDSMIVIGSLVFLLGIALFIIWLYRMIVTQFEELQRVQGLLQKIHLTDQLDHNLTVILELVQGIIEAPYYAFYIGDIRGEKYTLRVTTHPFDEFDGIGPAYSGIALPKRETYLPPLVVDRPSTTELVELVTSGEVPLILIRFDECMAFIRVGPVQQLRKKSQRQLQKLSGQISHLIDDLIHIETERERAQIAVRADESIRKIAGVATDKRAALTLIVSAFTGLSGSLGGVIIDFANEDRPLIYGTDLTVKVTKYLQEDHSSIQILEKLLDGREYRLVTRSDMEFYSLPSYILEQGCGAIVVTYIQPNGLLLIMYGEGFDAQTFLDGGPIQIKLLVDQLSNIQLQESSRDQLSKIYSRILWNTADVLDGFQTYTVAYSDMMTRYSLAIGKKLHLSDEQLTDLALAAHLSNIGTIGISSELIVKSGKYTDFEYETMQLHSEIGAAMIQIATGNDRTASYVLYHHERMDGQGYPVGLKGKDIPIGARILHVVQFFLAKIDGRPWRDPVSFDVALDSLQLVAGKQLDPEVVQALIEWFEERGRDPAVKNQSLGRCYEMCCTPRVICETCPVFHVDTIHCWEVGDNRCKSHGRSCSTCFVRTEYLSRETRLTAFHSP